MLQKLASVPSYSIPLKDGGKTQMAALYGGTILSPGIISDDGLQECLHSIAHFKDETKKAKLDVELRNHPPYDNLQEKRIAGCKE
jgi:hypothetical protein